MSFLLRFALALSLATPTFSFAEEPSAPAPLKQIAPVIVETPKTDTTAVAKTVAPAATCDGKMLDEFMLHISQWYCVKNFYRDPSCLDGLYKGIAVSGGLSGASSLGAMTAEWIGGRKLAEARAVAEADASLAANPEFKSSLEKALNQVRAYDVEAKKHFTSGQMRARALSALESMATEAESKAKVRAIGVAASRLASIARFRTWTAALFSGAGTIVAVVEISRSMIGSAGDCNDNGLEYVDLVARRNGGEGCETSFDLNGPKLNKFFRKPREEQLRILRNDKATCDYLNLFDQGLKQGTLEQLQSLNNLEIKKIPSCRADGSGVEFEGEVGNTKFRVSSTQDPADKKFKWISISKNIRGTDVPDPMTATKIIFQSSADGKKQEPYRITGKNHFGVDWSEDYEAVVKSPTYDRDQRVDGAVDVIGKTQWWARLVSSCCDEPEKNRESCWMKSIPSLKKEETNTRGDLQKTEPVTPPANRSASPGVK